MIEFVTFYTVLLTIITLLPLQVQSDPLASLDIENIWEILRRLQRLENYKKSQNKLIRTTKAVTFLQEQQKNEKPFFDDVDHNDFVKLLNKIKENKLRLSNSRESNQVESEGQFDDLNILPKKAKATKNILRFIPNMPYVSKQVEESESSEKNEENSLDLQDYSKIFVVLDPKVVAKSKHQDELRDIRTSREIGFGRKYKQLSQLVNQRAISKRPKSPPEYKYKGFSINNNNVLFARRQRGGDAEPVKNPQGKPGIRRREGGSASRTAIPYMNYRGDIYEHEKK